MKKTIIYLITFLLIIQIALAIDECKGTMNSNEIPCLVILPINTTETACNTLTVAFYNNTINLYNQTMQTYSPFSCNGTFNMTPFGTYSIYYTSGDSGSIIIEEDVNNRYYLYVVALIIFFILLGLGFYKKEPIFIILSGILAIVIALNLFFNGFPDLTNEFLKNGICIVLAGIGFYFIIAPSLEVMEEW